jgi:hypothetical protein
MAVYSINYDLNRPGQNYAGLIKAIEDAFPARWNCLKSTWLVRSDSTSVKIRDHLLPHIDSNDKLFVSEVTRNCAWSGFPEAGSKWLKESF